MEDGVIVKTIERQQDKIVHGIRRLIFVEIDGDITDVGANDSDIVFASVDFQLRRCVVVAVALWCINLAQWALAFRWRGGGQWLRCRVSDPAGWRMLPC